MSSCTHAMVEGINAKLAEIGEVAWPNEKVASEVCYEISRQLDGPQVLPAEGLNKESALMIAQLIKEANDACIADGGVTAADGRAYVAKTASDVRDIESLAAEVAGNCMLKAAEDTLLSEPGGSGDNSLEAAAANGDALAKLDIKNRGAGSLSAGLGQTAMPTDVGQVGVVMPHPEGADMNSVPNSLDIKMAQLRAVIEHVKTAGRMGDKVRDAVGGAQAAGGNAYEMVKRKKGLSTGAKIGIGAGVAAVGAGAAALATRKKKEEATKEASTEIGKRKGPVGRAVASAMGFAKKNKGAIGAVGAAGAAGVAAGRASKGDKEKTASYQETVMRGFYKAAADVYFADGLRQLKVASPEDLDPDQLRQLADYIEQNISQEGDNVDLAQLDPQTLAALHAQGGAEMQGDEEPEEEQGPPGMPPQMKGASILERIKKAAEGGPAGTTGDNTLSAAASGGDALSKLDEKNRGAGSLSAGLGQTNFPNVGQVGHTEVVAPSENPKNTMTTELKSAADREFLAQIEKMANIYGDQLPNTLNRVEKIAALKALSGLAPSERSGFLAALR